MNHVILADQDRQSPVLLKCQDKPTVAKTQAIMSARFADMIELASWVLVKTADPDIADALTVQDMSSRSESVRETL